MPCFTVNTITVEFKAENRGLLDSALKKLGLDVFGDEGGLDIIGTSIRLNLQSGTAQFSENERGMVNRIKRAYSQEVISLACRQRGWLNKAAGEVGEQTNGFIGRY